MFEVPDPGTRIHQRERAIFAVLLYYRLLRKEAALLIVAEIQERFGIKHLRIHGNPKVAPGTVR
ncbi:hypothetical protein D3C72_2489880 [compost metagenome]